MLLILMHEHVLSRSNVRYLETKPSAHQQYYPFLLNENHLSTLLNFPSAHFPLKLCETFFHCSSGKFTITWSLTVHFVQYLMFVCVLGLRRVLPNRMVPGSSNQWPPFMLISKKYRYSTMSSLQSNQLWCKRKTKKNVFPLYILQCGRI